MRRTNLGRGSIVRSMHNLHGCSTLLIGAYAAKPCFSLCSVELGSRIQKQGPHSSLPPPVSLLELDPFSEGVGQDAPLSRPTPPPLPAAVVTSDLDLALTAQIAVAWAGEGGEEPRLGWWRTDLISEFGGEDLFRRLLPQTWEWALLQAVREAARRKDEELRRQSSDADRLVSIYHFGFELDERIEERLQSHKRSDRKPHEALPDLFHGMGGEQGGHWNQEAFLQWVAGHGTAEVTTTPSGRRIKGPLPGSLAQQVHRLVAALAPLGERYPLPHFFLPHF
jgi:hypothetical protein